MNIELPTVARIEDALMTYQIDQELRAALTRLVVKIVAEETESFRYFMGAAIISNGGKIVIHDHALVDVQRDDVIIEDVDHELRRRVYRMKPHASSPL